MTSRLFIGLELPQEVKDTIIKKRDAIYGNSRSLNWEGEDKLHITLKFLGDVGENVRNLMIQRFESIEYNTIEAQLNKFEFFKKDGKLRILFASLMENINIFEFQKLIEDEAELIGFKREKRRYYPHITILRLKGKEDITRIKKFYNLSLEEISFTISKFSIIESRLSPAGSEYFRIKSFNLL